MDGAGTLSHTKTDMENFWNATNRKKIIHFLKSRCRNCCEVICIDVQRISSMAECIKREQILRCMGPHSICNSQVHMWDFETTVLS